MAASLGRLGREEACYSHSSSSAPLQYSFPPLMAAGDNNDLCPPDAAAAAMPVVFPELGLAGIIQPSPDQQHYSLPLPPETFPGCGGGVAEGDHNLDGMVVMDIMHGMSSSNGSSGFPFPAATPCPWRCYHQCCGGSSSNKGDGEKEEQERSHRIGFRTRSSVEVMEDGFRWRKYGKKAVKSSPNLRNYYRCSAPGCGVKKRVERDRHDPAYVITTYHGVHSHPTPAGTT